MITIVHGGQTGVDRGAHEAAIANNWRVTGYMPRDCRDELGQIPPDVAKFLTPHEKAHYAARTEANVRTANAALIVVQDEAAPRMTPGTIKTIDLVAAWRLRRMIVDPSHDSAQIADWIWNLLRVDQPSLPLGGETGAETAAARLLVAGPRESKWRGACAETTGLLRRVALALAEIPRQRKNQDLIGVPG